MSQHDLRGFAYALEPARRRAEHRVDAAIGLLGQRQQAVTEARQRARSIEEQCVDLARRGTPDPRAPIDPRRALALSQRLQQLSGSLAAARRDIAARQAEADEVRLELERARIEQQAFDSHREDALRIHVIENGRRLQAAADQDWLARQHVLRTSSETKA